MAKIQERFNSYSITSELLKYEYIGLCDVTSTVQGSSYITPPHHLLFTPELLVAGWKPGQAYRSAFLRGQIFVAACICYLVIKLLFVSLSILQFRHSSHGCTRCVWFVYFCVLNLWLWFCVILWLEECVFVCMYCRHEFHFARLIVIQEILFMLISFLFCPFIKATRR